MKFLSLILLVLCAALASCAGLNSSPGEHPHPDAIVVKVNGEPILQRDIDRRAAELLREAWEASPPDSEEDQARTQVRLAGIAREELIDKKLVEQAIRRAGIAVADARVEARIRAMTRELGREGITSDSLRAAMRVPPERFRELVRAQLAMESFWDRRLGISPPGEADLKKIYKDNLKYFQQPPAVHLFQVFVAKPLNPTRAQVRAVRLEADAMRARLQAGETFSSVARDAAIGHGGHTAPAGSEGDLGWVTPQSPLSPRVLDAAFHQQTGKLGEVIEAPEGFYILVVGEGRPARQVPFEELRERLAEQKLRAERAKRIPAEIRKMRKEAQIHLVP